MPRAGLEPVRVGPEAIEAGDAASRLVGESGLVNQADDLIKAVRDTTPEALRRLQMLPEDENRSATLDLDEVEKALSDQIGGKNVALVHGGRVRGADGPEAALQVVVLYEKPSGRTARAAVPYGDLRKSKAAYEEAEESGEFDQVASQKLAQPDAGDPEEIAKLKAALRKAEKNNAKLREGKGKGKSKPKAADKSKPPAGFLKSVKTVTEGVGSLSDEQLAAATAQEEGKKKPRKGVIDALAAEAEARKG